MRTTLDPLSDLWLLLQCTQLTEDGCLVWQRPPTTAGYGQIMVDGKMSSPHRLSYALRRGIPVQDIPQRTADGEQLVIRHLCNRKLCIHPDHLALGTAAQNVQDAILAGTHHSVKLRTATHCKYGHEWTDATSYVNPTTGVRKCRTCNAARSRQLRARKRRS